MRYIFSTLFMAIASIHSFASSGAHGDVESAGLPQLDVSTYPSQIFWLAIMFVVLYVFFSKWTLPTLSKIIETRSQNIKSDLEIAQKLKDEAQAVKDSYEKSLNNARAEASELFTKAEEAAKERSKKAQDDFRKDRAERIKDVEASIAAARDKALLVIDGQADSLAESVVEKVLKKV